MHTILGHPKSFPCTASTALSRALSTTEWPAPSYKLWKPFTAAESCGSLGKFWWWAVSGITICTAASLGQFSGTCMLKESRGWLQCSQDIIVKWSQAPHHCKKRNCINLVKIHTLELHPMHLELHCPAHSQHWVSHTQ